MVHELLPDLRSAAANCPESLIWPPPTGVNAATAQGAAAMAGLVAVTVWLRFSSLRLLTWNRNYNVKPREISAALDRLGANLVQVGPHSYLLLWASALLPGYLCCTTVTAVRCLL